MALLGGNVKLVLAPHVAVRLDGPQHLSADDLARYPSVEVSEESRDLLEHVVDGAIQTYARRVVDAERQVDAPPFRPGTWWLATVSEGGSDGEVAITSFPPSFFYGIDIAGRVHFLHRDEVRVDDFARALDEGHHGPTDGTLLVTRAGEFGGNGAFVPSLVVWFVEMFPGVLLGVGADRLVPRHDEAKREELQRLAGAWAARHIAFPSSLRQYVETRPVWNPEALARRLDLSPTAASRLLRALGYKDCGEDMFEFDGSSEAEAARDRRLDAERSHSGFATLDELLAGPGTTVPQTSAPATRSQAGSIAEIGALYVAPEHHGQGIGGALLRTAASELVTLGFSALHLGVLTANLRARSFYEAMGGHEIGQRTFDEEGYLLPVTLYGWSDINTLVGDSSETS